jgi:hypothetical protein
VTRARAREPRVDAIDFSELVKFIVNSGKDKDDSKYRCVV